MTAKDFAQYIQRARPHQGYWLGCCPAHDDQHESLSWKDGARDVIAKCHAGCTWAQIRAAAHLPSNGHGPPPTSPRTLIATYTYQDTSGAICYQVRRYDPKDFRPYRPNDKGGWIAGLGQAKRVVYHLPDLVGEAEVWWVEGEKDADRLCSLGFMASTSQGGSSNWRPEYAQQLVEAGVRTLIIIPDNDDPGRTYATQVADAVTGRGLEARIISLPGVPLKGDVSDWLDAGATTEDLRHQAEQAPVYTTSEPTPLTVEAVGDSYFARLGDGQIEYTRLEESGNALHAFITARNTATQQKHWQSLNLAAGPSRATLAKILDERCPGVPWRSLVDDSALEVADRFMAGEPESAVTWRASGQTDESWWVPGLIRYGPGAVSLLFGRGGSGKSITALALTLASLRGASLGGSSGWVVRPLRGVLYLDWESDKATFDHRVTCLLRGEGLAADALPATLHHVQMTRPLAHSLPQVSAAIRRRNPEAIVIDSWVPACGFDARNDAEATSRTMAAIRTLGLPALGITHITNAAADGESESRPFASVFNQNLPRSVIRVTGDRNGSHTTVTYTHTKVNDGPLLPPRTLTFTYSDGEIAVEAEAVVSSHLPLYQQLEQLIRERGPQTVDALAVATGRNEGFVKGELNRKETVVFNRLKPSTQGGRGRKVLWDIIK